MSQDPPEEIALRLVTLEQSRPRMLGPQTQGQRKVSQVRDAYRDHMHAEYLLQEEIYRRVGLDNAQEIVEKARRILNLLS